MSIPRNTDVSRHTARKPHLTIVPKAESTPAAGSAKAELKSLSEDLSAAVNSAQGSSLSTDRLGDDQ